MKPELEDSIFDDFQIDYNDYDVVFLDGYGEVEITPEIYEFEENCEAPDYLVDVRVVRDQKIKCLKKISTVKQARDSINTIEKLELEESIERIDRDLMKRMEKDTKWRIYTERRIRALELENNGDRGPRGYRGFKGEKGIKGEKGEKVYCVKSKRENRWDGRHRNRKLP